MGSSLILQGGAAVAKTLKESVTQTGHGFTVGDVIRWDGLQVPPKYVKAIADTAQNAEVAGVVSSTPDPNEFEVTYHGYIDLPSLAGISAPVMFLSGAVGGSLAASPPSAVGTVVKPVLTKNSNGSGYLVMNYLGTQIGGSSTIAVDEIQPVGTIMPYAGTAIPDTWLACDGASYAISDYPELYNRTRYTTGAGVPLHGYIIELGMNSSASVYYSNLAIGNILLFSDTGNPTSTSYDNIGVVVSKTAPNIASPGANPVTVKILPKYDSTLKKFAFANHLVTNTTGIVPFTNETLGTRVTGAVANAHSSNFSVVVHALCPDLRGRTVVGTNASVYDQTDGDAGLASAVGVYDLGQQGGEESHILTTAEMPAHKHNLTNGNSPISRAFQADGNVSGNSPAKAFQYADAGATPIESVGSNTPHNNMPPYLAVRYIIKAKPYTRAAIVDGIDLPYSSLLVRDLRSRNVGGSNGDLVFHTNTSGDGGNGTERMRIDSSGNVGIGTAPTSYKLTVGGSSPQFSVIDSGTNLSRALITVTPGGVSFGNTYSTTAIPIGFNIGVTEVARFDTSGNLGIGTSSPAAKLDVNGTLRVGNFGGATNVMVKPARVSGGGVGHVVPLFTWSSAFNSTSYDVMNHTTPLHAGTWLVYFAGHTDSGIESENFSCVMNHVWTVPDSKWLTFATSTAFTGTGTGVLPSVTSDSDSRVWYKIHDSLGTLRTASIAHGTITAANGWTSLNSNNAYTLGTQDATDITKIGFVYSNKWYGPVNLMGYAIRIA